MILGLVGPMRSGKDTVAEWLVKGHGFVRHAFADNVRQALLDTDPLVDIGAPNCVRLSAVVDEEGWEAAKAYPEVRRLLQSFGTDSIRKLDPYFWTRLVMRQIKGEARPVVIADVRFRNEAMSIRKAGGHTVRIIRPGLAETKEGRHLSETSQADLSTDFELMNDSTLDALTRNVDRLVEHLRTDQSCILRSVCVK